MNKLVGFLLVLLVVSLPFVHAVSLSYDANGNLVGGDGKYREYNSLNQLWHVYNGSSVGDPLLLEFVYHPSEERVFIKREFWNNGTLKEKTIYLSETFVRVTNSSGDFDFVYVWVDGRLVAQLNADGSKEFVHSDHLGSSSVVTNGSGVVIENTTYAPFGEVLGGGEESRYGYEGKEHDGVLGDTDFDFRRYKSEWGIFTQPDSLLPKVYDSQQLNRYSFERNNPYIFIDENGHFNLRVFGFGLTGFAGGLALFFAGPYGVAAGHMDVAIGFTAMVASFGVDYSDDQTADELTHAMAVGPITGSLVLSKDTVLDEEKPQNSGVLGSQADVGMIIVGELRENDACKEGEVCNAWLDLDVDPEENLNQYLNSEGNNRNGGGSNVGDSADVDVFIEKNGGCISYREGASCPS